jgi:leucyl/phenylalanyl-tRNA--protein transferase
MDEPLLTPDMLLEAYAAGIFPMAESRGRREVHWVDPARRGVMPLDRFHISRSLRRRIARGGFAIRTDSAFRETVAACADRDDTWISQPIFDAYLALHAAGHAHSLEVWEGESLIGGVYGVTLGAAFFGESMFSRRTDASKIALAFLVERLARGGFTLFDTQFLTPHLASLGAIEIARAEYHRRLAEAVGQEADFNRAPATDQLSAISQRTNQTS